MRILYLTGHYPPDLTSGATLQVQRLAAAARRAGHEVLVVAGAHRGGLADGERRDDTVDGIDVCWIGTAGWTDQSLDANWTNPAIARVVGDVLDSWRPDVVHAHALQTLGADALAAASDRAVRTVVSMHDFWWVCARLFLVDRDLQPCPLVPSLGTCDCARSAGWRRERERQLRDVLGRVDVVVTPSQAMADGLAANGIAALVDPNDVEPSSHPPMTTTSPRTARRSDAVRFLYVGGPNPLKGADVLRDAAVALGELAGWHLTAYGLDGPTTPTISTPPPFDPTVRDAVFADADVLVLPSIARESFSLAAREALQAGLAVITSDCLGPEEVVHHDENGLVVPTGDVGALAAAMRSLVDDRDRLARLQAGARATSIAPLDADQHLAALLPFYDGTADAPMPLRPRSVVVAFSPGDRDEAVRQVERAHRNGWDARLEGEGPGDSQAVATIVVGNAATTGATVTTRPTPRVRVVVVNHRGRDLTLRCLQHLDASTYPRDRFEVVIVDNASDDGLVEYLRRERPDVTVIANPDNRGFGAGCNAGIAAPGDWDAIALVNNDSTPRPGWLDALVATWMTPPVTSGPVGAVAGKVLLADSGLVNSAGCELREGGFNGDRGDGEVDDGRYDTPCEVFGWSGASVLLSKEMIDDIGTFDESFFLYYEDVDMVWRGHRRGWSVAYAPDAISDHDRGATAGRTDLFWFHDTRNRLIVLARHAPMRWFVRALAIQVRALVIGGPGPTRSVRFRSLASLTRRIPGLLVQRRRLAGRTRVGVDEITAWCQR